MTELRIKPKIWGHIIIVFFVLLLMGITYWALFVNNEVRLETNAYIILIIIFSIGTVVLLKALQIIIKKPDVIAINSYGFEYNPGGISSGLIPWSNVQEVKRVSVLTEGGNVGGPIYETTLAVKLKDPADYAEQYNFFLKSLMKLNHNLYDADIFMRLASFGNKAAEVEELMMKYSRK